MWFEFVGREDPGIADQLQVILAAAKAGQLASVEDFAAGGDPIGLGL